MGPPTGQRLIGHLQQQRIIQHLPNRSAILFYPLEKVRFAPESRLAGYTKSAGSALPQGLPYDEALVVQYASQMSCHVQVDEEVFAQMKQRFRQCTRRHRDHGRRRH